MTIWIKIKNDVVVNLVEQEETPPNDEFGDWIIRPNNRQWVGVGCLYQNGVFKRNPNIPHFLISKDAFLARFTAEELLAIRNFADNNPDMKAILDGIEARRKISLNSPKTLFDINAFLANDLVAHDRAQELLAPASPEEAVEFDEEVVVIPTEEEP